MMSMSMMMAALLAHGPDTFVLAPKPTAIQRGSGQKPQRRSKPDHVPIPCSTADTQLSKRQKRRLRAQ